MADTLFSQFDDLFNTAFPYRSVGYPRLAEAAAPGAPPGHLHCQTVVDDPGVGYQWFIEMIDPIQIGQYSSFDRREIVGRVCRPPL